MPVILPGILSLEQHLAELRLNPEHYRPARCPHCGRAGLGGHGHYARKADREGGGRLNPIPIPRFCCAGCRRTCSVLPQCLAPRRWYGWALQQVVLVGLLAGTSARALSRGCLPGRRTIGRWWRRWQAQFAVQGEKGAG
ncbi:DUF6431 domain-containing protein [Thiorhodococcus minor]|uniref:DUF6431 domain-containing protein n=1 Tax=Thiorhodococcus minor TaxID=57489 RepID=A0A6M0K662_9GAMM|nr:DUF6431 domain-containing protein [Thiorhodococcus minor]NEV65266.1 hypothetical protein [Thiorhodococcus minor]